MIGGILCTVVAACNLLLGLRRSPISIQSTVVQLISYPYVFLHSVRSLATCVLILFLHSMGVYWAKFMPNASFNFFGRKIELNPGPFNMKGWSASN